MDLRFINETGVSDHSITDLETLLDKPEGLVWLDIPSWDEDAETRPADVFCLHPTGGPGLRAAQPGAQGPRVSRARLPGAARPARGRRRPRALRGARPVHRPAVPGHRARPAQPGGRPRGGRGRGQRGRCTAWPPGGCGPPEPVRAVLRAGVRARPGGCGTTPPPSPRTSGHWNNASPPGISATRSSSWTRCSAPGTGCSP